MGNVFSFSCLQSYSKYIHRLFHAVSHEIFSANFTKLCGFNNGVRCFLTRILLILFLHIFPMKLKAERLLDRQKIHIFQNHHTTYWSNKTSRRLMLLKRNFDPNPGTTNFGKILKRFDMQFTNFSILALKPRLHMHAELVNSYGEFSKNLILIVNGHINKQMNTKKEKRKNEHYCHKCVEYRLTGDIVASQYKIKMIIITTIKIFISQCQFQFFL